MRMIMHVVGMAALARVPAAFMVMIVLMLDTTRRFTWERHVAAVVVGGIMAALGLVRLAAVLGSTLTLEATATPATATTPTAAPRAAFTVTFMAAGLARLGRTVLLQRDLLMDGLLAHGLRLGRCHDGSRDHRRRGRNLAAGRLGLLLRAAFLTLATVTALAARTTVVAVTALAVMPFVAA